MIQYRSQKDANIMLKKTGCYYGTPKKIPLLNSTLTQLKPVSALIHNLFKIHLNVVLPSCAQSGPPSSFITKILQTFCISLTELIFLRFLLPHAFLNQIYSQHFVLRCSQPVDEQSTQYFTKIIFYILCVMHDSSFMKWSVFPKNFKYSLPVKENKPLWL